MRRCADEDAIYAYFDSRGLSAVAPADFRIVQIDQPLGSLVQNSIGHWPVGTRPFHPLAARAGRVVYRTHRFRSICSSARQGRSRFLRDFLTLSTKEGNTSVQSAFPQVCTTW